MFQDLKTLPVVSMTGSSRVRMIVSSQGIAVEETGSVDSTWPAADSVMVASSAELTKRLSEGLFATIQYHTTESSSPGTAKKTKISFQPNAAMIAAPRIGV